LNPSIPLTACQNQNSSSEHNNINHLPSSQFGMDLGRLSPHLFIENSMCVKQSQEAHTFQKLEPDSALAPKLQKVVTQQ
jgi:hypothetical protein